MFNLLKKKEMVLNIPSDEKVKNLFTRYFIPFEYPEWQQKNGINALPNSGVIVFHEHKLTSEDIDYILGHISKKKPSLMDKREIEISERLEDYFFQNKQRLSNKNDCILSFIKYELIFLCDKILTQNAEA